MAFLGLIIRKLTGITSIGIISYVVVYPTALFVFIIHLIKAQTIDRIHKNMIGLVIVTILLSFISKVFHLPGYGILRLFSILPLCLIFYMNLKRIHKLREELRMLDLLAITMIIDLLVFSEKYWN